MTRPRRLEDDRVSTSIRFDRNLHERLLAAATEREISVNWLVNRAVADFLERLLPPDEIRWTR